MNLTNKAIAEKFEYWLKNAVGDPDLVKELRKIEKSLAEAKTANDRETITKIEGDLEDRFYRELEFGTGGLRGVIGAGTNRMNFYTVARATQGLADFVNSGRPGKSKSVAIAYDSRHKSAYFARTAAQVLAANDIKCHIYSELMPTPMLSFAVRKLKCDAGIVITASHNPAKYNGYKAYGRDGCQLSLEDSEVVIKRVDKLDLFSSQDVRMADFDEAFDKGMITKIDEDVIEDYFANVKEQSLHKNVCADSGLKVVFTPLNGAGKKPVLRILKEIGINDVTLVAEQANPDGNFPTCPYPNPEFREALEVGLDVCRKTQSDLLIATDPDCDRVGIAVRDDDAADGYSLFSGNEVGAMLLEYICRERKAADTLPLKPVAVKSIVSTAIADKIAEKYGVKSVDTLTGFKFIAGIAGELEKKGEVNRFIYGFEESYGYLAGSYVRDKDAVCASMLICEMAAFYRKNGSSLLEARRKMYEDYGYYHHYTQNLEFQGSSGMAKMKSIMEQLRRSVPRQIAGIDVTHFYDYSARTIVDFKNPKNPPKSISLPKSNVVKFVLEGDSVVIVRPSGTEPKLKVYYTCVGTTQKASYALLDTIMREFSKIIG
ncbi:MAG: phospho-sugar mutase [Oscillospiraceae bacterium]|nr:phospho-sugar mutase [Oscillospiraceae bacterium]